MLVVADSSPINILLRIGHIGLLPDLFGRVVIPSAVANELTHPKTPASVAEFIRHSPAWLSIQDPRIVQGIASLDLGERAAISLAIEISPDFILIDERAGRAAAKAEKLRVIGTLGILELAANRKWIDLRAAFERLKLTDFHYQEELLDSVLARHEKGN